MKTNLLFRSVLLGSVLIFGCKCKKDVSPQVHMNPVGNYKTHIIAAIVLQKGEVLKIDTVTNVRITEAHIKGQPAYWLHGLSLGSDSLVFLQESDGALSGWISFRNVHLCSHYLLHEGNGYYHVHTEANCTNNEVKSSYLDIEMIKQD